MSKISRTLLFVTVCFLLHSTSLSSQGWGLSDSTIQVMKRQLHTSDNDTVRIQMSWNLALYYVTTQLDSARHYFHAGYLACKDIDYAPGKAWSSVLTGFMYFLQGDYVSAYQWINTSRRNIKEIKVNVEDPIFELINVGNTWANPNESFYGLKAQHEQITGHIYARLGMNKEALGHYLENLSLLKNTSNTSYIGRAQWNVGSIYLRMDSIAKAEPYLLQANENISDDDTYKGGASLTLAWLERLKGNQSQRLAYIQESFEFSEKNNNYLELADGHHALGRYYYDEGDYDRSLAAYIKADEIDRKVNPNYKGYDSMLGRAKCYKEKGDLDKAYALNTEGQRLKAENEAERKVRINAFHRYILDEKEALQEERIKVEQVRSQRRTLGFSLLALLLSVIGLLLFRNNRQKQRSNEQLAGQKVKLEHTLTNLKATQAQLIQSEKMASLGELTAGIAHEIQNPLNFVNNFSDVSNELIDEMKEEFEKGDVEEAYAIAADIKGNLEKITHHGRRAESIVKGMLQHSRNSEGEKIMTDINALCDEYLRLAYHGLRAKDKAFNASMTTDFDENVGKVLIVPQDLSRVVLNILTNAFYTVNNKSKEHVVADFKEAYEPNVTVKTTAQKDTITIAITDNGQGIPEEARSKIFQPFYTTKPTGEGTGLGLSMSYDIITKSHGGQLSVDSKEGEGSTFMIKIPRFE